MVQKFSKKNSQIRWTSAEDQPRNFSAVVEAISHIYVCFSLCQDLNNLPGAARKKKDSGEDGVQGNLQKDTKIIARRGEKGFLHIKVIFHSN